MFSSRWVTMVKSITIVSVAFMQMHCCFKHNGYVAYSVRNVLAFQEVCVQQEEVWGEAGSWNTRLPFLLLPVFATREWLKVCQVWVEWETGSRLWGILPQQTSIITHSRNLHGDRNVFFNNSKSWTLSLPSHSRSYRQLSNTCATNAYLRHSTCYSYKKETCIKCTV